MPGLDPPKWHWAGDKASVDTFHLEGRSTCPKNPHEPQEAIRHTGVHFFPMKSLGTFGHKRLAKKGLDNWKAHLPSNFFCAWNVFRSFTERASRLGGRLPAASFRQAAVEMAQKRIQNRLCAYTKTQKTFLNFVIGCWGLELIYTNLNWMANRYTCMRSCLFSFWISAGYQTQQRGWGRTGALSLTPLHRLP